MKRILLILITAFAIHSVNGLPIDGKNSWRELIFEHQCITIPTTKASASSMQNIHSNLCFMEKELMKLNLGYSKNCIDALLYVHDNMHKALGLPENDSLNPSLNELISLRNALIEKIQQEKSKYAAILLNMGVIVHIEQVKSVNSKNTIAKYLVASALITTAAIYSYKNREALKNTASELTTKFLSSEFASNVSRLSSKAIANAKKATLNAREMAIKTMKDISHFELYQAPKNIL